MILKKIIIILLFTISCTAQDKNNDQLYKVDSMEASVRLKSKLPWFAQYQVGEPVVEGFPGESSKEKKQRLQKWRDSKYGLFIHWQPRIAGGQEVISNDSINAFNPTDFNAERWVQTAQRLGFKYMVVILKHRSGFCMFDSKYTDYDIVDATPFKRDPIKELAEACVKYNFQLGLYYNLRNAHHPDFTEDIGSAKSNKYQQYMLNQVQEITTNYGPLVSLWFDADFSNSWTVERATEMRDLVRKTQPDIVMNNRIGQRKQGAGDYASTESFMPYIGSQDYPWEGCAKFDGGWFYNGTNNSKTADWALYNLCYATSRGGNFLMNLGPTPKGNFLDTSVEKLEKVGEWLQTNGESIYEAQKGPHYFLEWGTSTRKGNTLYYQVFDWPENGELIIPGLKTEVKSASFLADKSEKPLEVKRYGDDVLIKVPNSAPYPMANVLKVELMDLPNVDNASRALKKGIDKKDSMREVPEGAYFLPAGFAKTYGKNLHFYYGTGAGAQRENLQGWYDKNDLAEWDINVLKDGKFAVEVTYSSWLESGSFEVEIADQKFKHHVRKIKLKGRESPLQSNFTTFSLGDVNLKPGRYKVKALTISDKAKEYNQGLMKLRGITLIQE